jgi:hypothetical protein
VSKSCVSVLSSFPTKVLVPAILFVVSAISDFGSALIASRAAGIVLNYWIKKLEVSWFELFFCGVFLNASTRCSVK